MMMRLDGKTVIITGASSGMGAAMARLFASVGAQVVAVARRQERLAALAQEATAGHILPVVADLNQDVDLARIVDETVAAYQRVDILINNAGIMDNMVPLGELTDELWEQVMRIDVTAPMKLMRRVLPLMLAQGAGNIINIASVGGMQGCRAGAAYTAAKHALVGLTKNTAFMYANQGIRCNAICPGGVETEIALTGVNHPSELGLRRATMGNACMPRMGQPEELAQTALFLASEASSFVNGVALVVDGGWLAY